VVFLLLFRKVLPLFYCKGTSLGIESFQFFIRREEREKESRRKRSFGGEAMGVFECKGKVV
jgi:hypothetical protein